MQKRKWCLIQFSTSKENQLKNLTFSTARGKSREMFVATRDFYFDDEFRHSRPIYLVATLINDYCSLRRRWEGLYKVSNIYLGRSTKTSREHTALSWIVTFSLSLCSFSPFFLKSMQQIWSFAMLKLHRGFIHWSMTKLTLLHRLLVVVVYLY